MRPELQSICEHVGRYCREDRSEKAVLLSGEWGCGKSHFVHNELKEYLESKTQALDIVKCCYVSLYGVSSISEVSRRLFYELRGISTKSRTKAVAQIAVNTVARAALDSVHVDVNKLDDMLKEIQKVKTDDTLFIFDDVERMEMETLKPLFGFVNNLCELDGAKVLLIAAERELGKREDYKDVREKTIGDIIRFDEVASVAVPDVLEQFKSYGENNKYFDFANHVGMQSISSIVYRHKDINLRTLKFACQKYVEIMGLLNENKIRSHKELRQAFFYGILGFSAKYLSGNKDGFPPEGSFSNKLGLEERYPVFRPCYEYIVDGKFDEIEFRKIGVSFRAFFNRSQEYAKKNYAFKVLTEFLDYEDEEIERALECLNAELDSTNARIPYCAYGTLLSHVAVLQYDYGFDASVQELTDKICHQLENKAEEITYSELFLTKMNVADSKGKATLIDCCKRIERTVSPIRRKKFRLGEFISLVKKNHNDSNGIVYWIDPDDWRNELMMGKPKELRRLVEEMDAYYAGSKITSYMPEEGSKLNELLDTTKNIISTRSDIIGKKHLVDLLEVMEAVLKRRQLVVD